MYLSENKSALVNPQHFDFLSHVEEAELIDAYQSDGDVEAMERLVTSHLRLVGAMVRKYSGYGLSDSDLFQEGSVGLVKAAKAYDPTRTCRFSSFASYYIKAEILEFINRNWRIVKMATTKDQKKLFFNLKKLKGMKSSVSVEDAQEISDTLNVKLKEVFAMDERLGANDCTYDAPKGDESVFDHPCEYLEGAERDPAISLAELEEHQAHRLGLYQGMQLLNPRSREIILRRWMNEEKATLDVLSKEFGVSKERIRQIETNALKTIRKHMMAA